MNIVIFTKNWLGDVVFETPAIRAIKENFPDSHLIAVMPRRCREVLVNNPHVDEIIPFDDRREERTYAAKWRLVKKLRNRKIDIAFIFHRGQEHAVLAYLSNAKKRVGYATKWRKWFLNCAPEEPSAPIHDVQYFLDLVRAAGLAVREEFHYEFHYSEEHSSKAKALIQEFNLNPSKLVAINPGANWLPKRWPPQYFRQLSERLITKYGIQIVITGGQRDLEVAQEILDHRHFPGIISVCGKTDLGTLGALFSMCRLVISNDTGPLHIAGGVGSNVLALFGPTQSLETGPLGRGRNVLIHYYPEGASLPWIGRNFPSPWMELISVDYVMDIIEKEKLL